MKTIVFLASALAALPGGAAASADLAMDHPTVAVPVDDLDLTTAERQARLDKRIAVAVRQICYEAGPPTTQRQQRVAECRAAANERAQEDAERAIAQAAPRLLDRLASAEQP
jgi:UrcA family protein